MAKISNGFILLLLLGLCSPTLSLAEAKTAVADNGREVLLKENGEWEYVSESIYATTPDGQRIRLQPNQQWQKVNDAQAPAYQPVAITTALKDNATLGNGTITLDQVHIENQRETVGKNKRVRSNLVFYLELVDVEATPDIAQISVRDSKGKQYPVFSAKKGKSLIDQQPRIIVRAKGAPRWWGVKYFSVVLENNAVGNAKPIELRKPMNEVLRKEVSSLPTNSP